MKGRARVRSLDGVTHWFTSSPSPSTTPTVDRTAFAAHSV